MPKENFSIPYGITTTNLGDASRSSVVTFGNKSVGMSVAEVAPGINSLMLFHRKENKEILKIPGVVLAFTSAESVDALMKQLEDLKSRF